MAGVICQSDASRKQSYARSCERPIGEAVWRYGGGGVAVDGEGWGGMHEVLDMWIGVDTDTAECYAGIESAAYGDNVEPL
jgi:hypothetical protein